MIVLLLLLALSLPSLPARAQLVGEAGKDAPAVHVVQAAAFRNEALADRLAKRLRGTGFPAAISVRLRDDHDTDWHVVLLGAAPNRAEAKEMARDYREVTGQTALVKRIDAGLLDERRAEARRDGAEDGGEPRAFVPSKSPRTPTMRPQAVSPAAPEPDETPFTVDALRRNGILAGALRANGRLQEALAVYEAMLTSLPPGNGTAFDDTASEYAETLAEAGEWGRLEAFLRDWLRARPASRAALYQTALLSVREGDPVGSWPWFERFLGRYPEDDGVRSDYAFALSEGGDWSRALEQYSLLLDHDPTNADIAAAHAAILAERRPVATFEFTNLRQSHGGETNSYRLGWEQQLSSTVRAFAEAAYHHVHRGDFSDTPTVTGDLTDRRVRLRWEAAPRWAFEGGVGHHQGFVDGFSGQLAAEHVFSDASVLRVETLLGEPWLDTLEAVPEGGSYDDVAAGYTAVYDSRWTLYASTGYRAYHLDDADNYGQQVRFGGSLTRRLLDVPALDLSYTYQRTRALVFEDSETAPVDLLRNESVHGLRADLRWNLTSGLDAYGFAGIQQDEFKPIAARQAGGGLVYALPGLGEIDLGYEHTTDNGLAGGGEAQTFRALFRLLF